MSRFRNFLKGIFKGSITHLACPSVRIVLQVHLSPSLPHSRIVLSSPHVAKTLSSKIDQKLTKVDQLTQFHLLVAVSLTSPFGLQAQHQTLPECPFRVAVVRSLISAITNIPCTYNCTSSLDDHLHINHKVFFLICISP